MKNNVSFNSELAKFGIGLFETIIVTNYPLDLDLHINRLYNSAKELNLNINKEKEFYKKTILEYIKEKVQELKDSGLDVGEGMVTSKKMFEEDWANNWKKSDKPIHIGEPIVIKPIWEDYTSKDGEMIVELDPGMAFGTGDHETTSMCIKALDKYIEKDTTVFDIGTGSGILAIVASKLGAKKVVGVDLDPVAVDSAKENISFNNLDNIEVLYGNLVEVVEGKADIVVANIIAEIICVLINDAKKVLNKGGVFITSGIIHDRRQMVIDALEKEDFEIIEVNKDGEWNCIVARLK